MIVSDPERKRLAGVKEEKRMDARHESAHSQQHLHIPMLAGPHARTRPSRAAGQAWEPA